MYTLYYSPGSCALIVHCLLEELGVPFDTQRVNTEKGEHRTEAYRRLNPKGKVPVLVTPEGPLTECVALIEYLCDRHDDGSLLGKQGSWERAKALERIATLATEIHPLYNRFFHGDDFADEESVREAVKARGVEKLLAWFRAEDAALTGPYWSGGTMTAADLYFMTAARWGRWLEPKVTRMGNIEAFMKRMGERPAVARAMAREGITPFELMQTHLADWIRDTPQGREADAILRKCVHCGFCLATCPTYTLLGDELDSPRGRIYLMKEMLEGAAVTSRTQLHLDRCLTCRACETTCPSGVEYGRLVDIGRDLVEQKVPRGLLARAWRWILRTVLPSRTLFGALLGIGRALKPVLPASVAREVPDRRPAGEWPAPRHARKMLVLDGCVQPAIAPSINAAAARVLDRLGISLVAAPRAGCCGAVAFHLNAQQEGLNYARSIIDAWWPHVESGTEAIIITATGCGTMVKEYGHLLRDDPEYAQKALRITNLAKDISEVITGERAGFAKLLPRSASPPATPSTQRRVAFHSPCSLQHGLKINGVVETILRDLGMTLTPVPDAHLCCGSAGTYSILQPALSQELLANKVCALESGEPEVIATANIGCLAHIGTAAARPIRHWIELVDEATSARTG